MKSIKLALCLVIAIGLLSGCIGTPVTIPSVPANDLDLTKGRPIKAQACGFQLLLLIPIAINSRLERAMEELHEKAGRDKIANVSVEEYWRYAFVGTTYCTSLEAIAYPTKSTPASK